MVCFSEIYTYHMRSHKYLLYISVTISRQMLRPDRGKKLMTLKLMRRWFLSDLGREKKQPSSNNRDGSKGAGLAWTDEIASKLEKLVGQWAEKTEVMRVALDRRLMAARRPGQFTTRSDAFPK